MAHIMATAPPAAGPSTSSLKAKSPEREQTIPLPEDQEDLRVAAFRPWFGPQALQNASTTDETIAAYHELNEALLKRNQTLSDYAHERFQDAKNSQEECYRRANQLAQLRREYDEGVEQAQTRVALLRHVLPVTLRDTLSQEVLDGLGIGTHHRGDSTIPDCKPSMETEREETMRLNGHLQSQLVRVREELDTAKRELKQREQTMSRMEAAHRTTVKQLQGYDEAKARIKELETEVKQPRLENHTFRGAPTQTSTYTPTRNPSRQTVALVETCLQALQFCVFGLLPLLDHLKRRTDFPDECMLAWRKILHVYLRIWRIIAPAGVACTSYLEKRTVEGVVRTAVAQIEQAKAAPGLAVRPLAMFLMPPPRLDVEEKRRLDAIQEKVDEADEATVESWMQGDLYKNVDDLYLKKDGSGKKGSTGRHVALFM